MKSAILSLVLSVAAAVVAPLAQANVTQAHRDAVLVVGPIPAGMPAPILEAYGNADALTQTATAILTPHYRAVHVLHGSNCGFMNFVNQVGQAAGNSQVQAVDVFLVGYGTDGKIHFGDGAKTGDDIEHYLGHFSSGTRAKFRAVFSTNSFGKAMNANWRNAGFTVTGGARQVCVDARDALPAFLQHWVGGDSFNTSNDAANSAGAARNGATIVGLLFSNPTLASRIDSRRVVAGSNRTINSNP